MAANQFAEPGQRRRICRVIRPGVNVEDRGIFQPPAPIVDQQLDYRKVVGLDGLELTSANLHAAFQKRKGGLEIDDQIRIGEGEPQSAIKPFANLEFRLLKIASLEEKSGEKLEVEIHSAIKDPGQRRAAPLGFLSAAEEQVIDLVLQGVGLELGGKLHLIGAFRVLLKPGLGREPIGQDPRQGRLAHPNISNNRNQLAHVFFALLCLYSARRPLWPASASILDTPTSGDGRRSMP
jgi:hypothetical protein